MTLQHFLYKVRVFLKKERHQLIIGLISLFFLVFCAFFIKHEILWFPYSVAIVFIVYLLFFRIDVLLYLTAFIVPFSIDIKEFIPEIDFGLSFPGEILLVAITFIFIARVLYENHYTLAIAKHPVVAAIIFYLFWIFITSITSVLPWVSFKFLLSKLWFIIPSFFLLAQLVNKDIKRSVTFFLSYALGLAVIVLMTSYKHMQMGDVEKVSHWIMSPYYNDHTAYGAVLAFFVCITAGMMFLPALTKKQRFLSSILMIIMLIGLFLSFSRAAWLSLIVAVGVGMLLFFKVKIKTVLIAFATMLVLLFTFQSLLLHQINKNEQESSTDFYEHIQSITNISSDASNVERINRWSSAVSMFKERPVFGFGPGTYQFQYAPFQRSKYRTIITTNSGDGGNAHSEYLGPLSESGILGTLSVIFLVITVFYSGINIYRKEKDKNIRIISLMCVLALTTYYTHGFLNNFLDTDKLAVPVFGAMAVIVALDVYRKNQSNISSNDEK